MYKIYLDDLRTPIDKDWIVVRNYEDFVSKVIELGLDNIEIMSLDHDLGFSATREYYNNTRENFFIDYNNIVEKTGYDCAKWLVNHYYDSESKKFPLVYTHSANPIGSANIMGYINNFLKNEKFSQSCIRVRIDHVISKSDETLSIE